jgi:hypothetical protein
MNLLGGIWNTAVFIYQIICRVLTAETEDLKARFPDSPVATEEPVDRDADGGMPFFSVDGQ